MWHVAEFESEEVPDASLGQFFSTDSYVIRWQYSISYTGKRSYTLKYIRPNCSNWHCLHAVALGESLF